MKVKTLAPLCALIALLIATVPAQAGSDGYAGLLAPSEDKPDPQKVSPYEGLLAPAEKTPEMSVASGLVPAPAPATSDDLRVLSTVYGRDKNGEGPLRGLNRPAKIPPSMRAVHQRIEGKLPVVYATEKDIEQAMKSVNDKNLSPDARAENARKAYRQLAPLADGLRSKQAMPDSLYRQTGLPDSYIREEKQGVDEALSKLEKTLDELKQYQ